MTRPLRSCITSLLLVLAALLTTGSAFAGSLQVHDSAGLLTGSDRRAIESAAARCPFDVRVLTSTDYADQGAFSRYVGAQVSEPNMIVVGVDPAHHHTQVHFGTGTRVAESQWSNIERAGNVDFRSARWAPGVAAILDAASGAATDMASVPARRSPGSGGGWPIGVVLLLVLGVVVAVGLAIRRAMSSGGPSYGPGPGGYGGYGPGYPGGGQGYAPGPGYGGGGGIGAVGGGLIGAGVGGLAGYELGKLEGENEERERERPRRDEYVDPGASEGGDDGSFDAGGGGSSWDDGGGGDTGGGGDGGGGSDW